MNAQFKTEFAKVNVMGAKYQTIMKSNKGIEEKMEDVLAKIKQVPGIITDEQIIQLRETPNPNADVLKVMKCALILLKGEKSNFAWSNAL